MLFDQRCDQDTITCKKVSRSPEQPYEVKRELGHVDEVDDPAGDEQYCEGGAVLLERVHAQGRVPRPREPQERPQPDEGGRREQSLLHAGLEPKRHLEGTLQ